MKERVSVYKPTGVGELCHPKDSNDFSVISDLINGEPRSASWVPIEVDLISEDDGRVLPYSDSPWLLSSSLIFGLDALARIGRELKEIGELLPLDCRDRELWIFNPSAVLNALDEGASEVSRFRDGRIMMVTRYEFREDVIRGHMAFKIREKKVSPTFVTQEFVDMWQAAGLTGLEFRRLWPDPDTNWLGLPVDSAR